MLGRREFLEASVAAATATAAHEKAAPASADALVPILEIRTYRLRIGPQVKVVHDFFAEIVVPGLARLGVGPIGAFEITFGAEAPAIMLLTPHDSLDAYARTWSRLEGDAAYRNGAAAAAYHGPAGQPPAYVRMDSALLVPMPNMPRIEPPPAAEKKSPRIFELRTYESPTEAGHARKMEMFTKMGETAIFRRVGLTPVFFGRTLVGPRQPNFVYMLTFPDLAARDRAWATFRADPEWQKLRATPGYTDADIMSNITDLILRPTPYSQI